MPHGRRSHPAAAKALSPLAPCPISKLPREGRAGTGIRKARSRASQVRGEGSPPGREPRGPQRGTRAPTHPRTRGGPRRRPATPAAGSAPLPQEPRAGLSLSRVSPPPAPAPLVPSRSLHPGSAAGSASHSSETAPTIQSEPGLAAPARRLRRRQGEGTPLPPLERAGQPRG